MPFLARCPLFCVDAAASPSALDGVTGDSSKLDKHGWPGVVTRRGIVGGSFIDNMFFQDSTTEFSAGSASERLDFYYTQIKKIILSRQDPVSGLLPASTAITAHGNYTDAWVRDNVYSILAVWGLGLAYRKVDPDHGRAVELEGCVVKLMRGLLFAMMRQAEKVERFKYTQSPADALHAKYKTETGATVVGDHEWGHLQLDATSIYLLMLAQMTTSGINIILTLDEVNFVQNLIYYIGRTYQTPDYGIWERGNKINSGFPELNASSVGMAKAAMEALGNLNVFGVRGSQASVLHVLQDEIARARITLESILPWESSSKEIDGALLSIIGFPAFAVEDGELVELTRRKIIDQLQGRYGCKRFLRDGHQTVLEDHSRIHYEAVELKQFEHIESEWPLFFTYLLLDCLFRKDAEGALDYSARLESLLVERDGAQLLPELYFVPAEKVQAEKQNPHSQTREPNENVPLVWAQSLYYLGLMLQEDLLHLGDIDPLGRHHNVGTERQAVVQIALLAEDEGLQAQLETHGIATATAEQIEPIRIFNADALSGAYHQIGRNDKLHLTGRPIRRLRSLSTSKIFRIRGELTVFLPSFLDMRQFYLTLDEHTLIGQLEAEIAYISRHWRQLGRPTMVVMLTHQMWETGREALLRFVNDLLEGYCGDVPVRLGPLGQLMGTAARERVDYLHDFRFEDYPFRPAQTEVYYMRTAPEGNHPLEPAEAFAIEVEQDCDALLDRLRNSDNLFEQVEILQRLKNIAGAEFDTGWGTQETPVRVTDLLNEAYDRAARGNGDNRPYWTLVRRTAALLGKADLGLTDAITDILVRQKQITVGKAYFEDALITRPLPFDEIMDKIRRFAGEDVREQVLTQEILVSIGMLIRTEPELFNGLLTMRVGYLELLIITEMADELGLRQEDAYEALMDSSPSAIQRRLRAVLVGRDQKVNLLRRQEALSLGRGNLGQLELKGESEPDAVNENWLKIRERQGALSRLPEGFSPRVWELLHHCQGLIIGEKMDVRNRLESREIVSESTAGEKNFAVRLEHLLHKIEFPEYRQLNVEALNTLATITAEHPEIYIEDFITLDVLIGHAVRQAYLHWHPEREEKYAEDKPSAWREFYESTPARCEKYVGRALQYLTMATR